MSWIQAFNQPYPGALQHLQAGGLVPEREQNSCYTGVGPAIGLAPAAYGQPAAGAVANYGVPRSRAPNTKWGRASNFQGGIGAVGPAIGLSPMVYGVPFPGYPSLAEQQKVGVSAAESEQWREVYAAQMRDRGANPASDEQVSPWYPTAGYGTGQYGSQYGPNPNPRRAQGSRRRAGVPQTAPRGGFNRCELDCIHKHGSDPEWKMKICKTGCKVRDVLRNPGGPAEGKLARRMRSRFRASSRPSVPRICCVGPLSHCICVGDKNNSCTKCDEIWKPGFPIDAMTPQRNPLGTAPAPKRRSKLVRRALARRGSLR